MCMYVCMCLLRVKEMQNSSCPSNHILLALISENGVAGQPIHSYWAGGLYHQNIWYGGCLLQYVTLYTVLYRVG